MTALDHPVVNYSRKLQPQEGRYSTIEKVLSRYKSVDVPFPNLSDGSQVFCQDG